MRVTQFTSITLLIICVVVRIQSHSVVHHMKGEAERRRRDTTDILGTYSILPIEVITPDDEPTNSTKIDHPSSGNRTGDFEWGGRKGHTPNITLSVTVRGQTYTLELSINRNLFSTGYREKITTNDGPQTLTTDPLRDHCHYNGKVKGYEDSVAAVSTCNGIEGFFTVQGETFSIEPVIPDSSSEGGSEAGSQEPSGESCLSCPHRVYRGLDMHNMPDYKCDVELGALRRKRVKRQFKWPQDLNGKTKIVELYVVNDNSQYRAYRGNLGVLLNRVKTIVNMATALYQQIDIYLVLVGVETWVERDFIPIQLNDSLSVLSHFCEYRMNVINKATPNDFAQFITAVGPFDGRGIIGKAYLEGMCSSSQSAGIASDIESLPVLVATTLVHEMGHSFGLEHDNDACQCSDPVGVCIMYYTNSPLGYSTKWSKCSTDNLAPLLTSGYDSCLYNVPPTIYDRAPLCGNGLVDSGEDCDCGAAPSSECNPACCDASTCRLKGNAQCAYGRCCNVNMCTMLPKFTTCRSSSGQCDVAEYCSGVEPICPSDVYKRDGIPCLVGSDESYCISGKCQSSSTQCQRTFGVRSQPLCYPFTNTRGDAYGNCGYVRKAGIVHNYNYTACQAADVACGALQCTNSTGIKLLAGLYFTGTITLNNIPGVPGTVYCNSAIYDFGDQVPDPGFVPDGSSCGTNKMCMSKKCVDVNSISTPQCPDCNHAGVCNSIGQCHCDAGFAPPDCSSPGNGGSLHSNGIVQGPTTPTRTTTVAITTTQTTITTATTRTTTITTSVSTSTSTSTSISTSTSTVTSTITSTSTSTVTTTLTSSTTTTMLPPPTTTTLGTTQTTTITTIATTTQITTVSPLVTTLVDTTQVTTTQLTTTLTTTQITTTVTTTQLTTTVTTTQLTTTQLTTTTQTTTTVVQTTTQTTSTSTITTTTKVTTATTTTALPTSTTTTTTTALPTSTTTTTTTSIVSTTSSATTLSTSTLLPTTTHLITTSSPAFCTEHGWTFHAGKNVLGMTELGQTGQYTEETCKTACIDIPSCTRVDYNRLDGTCFWSTAVIASLNDNSFVNHWELARCKATCVSRWTVTENQHANGLKQQGTAGELNEESCKSFCQANSSCQCVDYNLQDKTCWLGFERNPPILPAPAINHWDLTRCVASNLTNNTTVPTANCQNIWEDLPNTNSLHGVLLPEFKEMHECMNACIKMISCVGFDMKVLSANEIRCYFHLRIEDFDNIYGEMQTTQYRLHRCTEALETTTATSASDFTSASAEVCTANWTMITGRHTKGLKLQGNANDYTEASCKDACYKSASCNCVDYNFNDVTCWHGTQINPGTEPNAATNHWNLIRICPNRCSFSWTLRAGMHGLGLSLQGDPGQFTEESCKSGCEVQQSCRAIDYNRQDKTCWFSSESNKPLETNSQINHWELIRTNC